MTSDHRMIDARLDKRACEQCGLVRRGDAFDSAEIEGHYENYALEEPSVEPLFFDRGRRVPRSRVIADWLALAAERGGMAAPRSVLEIGCGSGRVLSQLAERWPHASLHGLDMHPGVAAAGRARGIDVRAGSYRDVTGRHDLIASFAVMEHVPSPRDYLSSLADHLTERGRIVVAVPCQDDGNYDVFFVDHLHHFFGAHVTSLGGVLGLEETYSTTEHALIPSFTIHTFRLGRRSPPPAGSLGDIGANIARWNTVLASVDRWIAQRKKIAVWGVGQAYTFLSAYTRLGSTAIECGFDDNPARFEGRPFGFPIVPLAPKEGTGVLVTFALSEETRRRLDAAGFDYFAPFGG